ncbi:MAG: glycerol-3-phosphate 1-O-acyltransferase PlsY [Bacteroidales bacterium]
MSLEISLAFILFSYLLGAIPFGYILTKFYTGENIMELGSGNVGSTNVKRVAGKRIAIITQVFDMLKGFLPVALYLFIFNNQQNGSSFFIYYIAISSIVGHDFSVFLKFKGGKGVNTTLGASLLLAPYSVLVAVVFYLIVKWKFNYVSLGSIVLACALPLVELIINGLGPDFYYLLVCMALIVLLHKKNIIRLLNNIEPSS